MSHYQNYQDVLNKGQQNELMNYREKKKLVQQIDKLETKDHIGILKIVLESIDKKIYTVNNYGTYVDLNDLENQVLWKISYHVNLCLENKDREKEKSEAEKKYLEDINQLEEKIRTSSKLKLTNLNLDLLSRKSSSHPDKLDDSDPLKPENKIGIDKDDDSELPLPENFSLEDSEIDRDNNDDGENSES